MTHKHSIMMVFTNMCNWNCSYCNSNCEINKFEIDYEYILRLSDFLFRTYRNSISHFNLSGGEPGLLEDTFWLEFISLIKKYNIQSQINLFTNGLIFKKKISHKIINNVNMVRWHCVQNLNESIPKYNISQYDNIQQLIVLTNPDLIQLYSFIERERKNITRPFYVVKNNKSNNFTTEKTQKIIDLLSHYDYNILHEENILNITLEKRIQCMIRYFNISINFEQKTISPCCKITSDIPLSKFNINQLLSNKICAYSKDCLNCEGLF